MPFVFAREISSISQRDSNIRTQKRPIRTGLVSVLIPLKVMIMGGFLIGTIGAAQRLPSRIEGSHDQDISVPASSQKPVGYSEAKALGELAAYKAATGGSAWAGMTAAGKMSYDGTIETFPAELSILPGNKVRLDITKPEGHEITVYNGARGSISSAGAKKVLIAPAGAIGGFAPFDLPLSAGGEEASRYSIVDHGSVTSDGNTFHRLSVEVPIAKKDLFPYEKEDRSVVDLYFDPSTHLLGKTSSFIPIPGSSQRILLKVDTYSEYKRVGGALIPTTITETINGQPIWRLVLDSFDSKKALSNKDFIF